MECRDSVNVWINSNDGSVESLFDFIIVFKTTATTVNGKVYVSYPVQSILPNMSARIKQPLIANGHTLVEYLTTYCIQKYLERREVERAKNCFCTDLHHR